MKRLLTTTLVLVTCASFSAHAGSVQSINSVSAMHDALQTNPLVVAEFYDSQCGACQAYRRTGEFEDAASKNSDIKFVEINMREAQSVFNKYGAKRVPSIFFFKNGNKVNKHMGAPSRAELDAKIKSLKK